MTIEYYVDTKGKRMCFTQYDSDLSCDYVLGTKGTPLKIWFYKFFNHGVAFLPLRNSLPQNIDYTLVHNLKDCFTEQQIKAIKECKKNAFYHNILSYLEL